MVGLTDVSQVSWETTCTIMATSSPSLREPVVPFLMSRLVFQTSGIIADLTSEFHCLMFECGGAFKEAHVEPPVPHVLLRA